MSKIRSDGWNPEADLAALLDALTEDLLAASARDVDALARVTGIPPDTVARDVRRLIASAASDLIVPPAAEFSTPGLRAYIARNQ
jgi:hypothetical protein